MHCSPVDGRGGMKTAELPEYYRPVLLNRVDSTNQEIKRLAAAGAYDGTLVWASEQTAGRGRRGRSWVSPRGNLYFSLLLRPRCPASEAMQIGFVTTVALADAIHAKLPPNAHVSCKWPNDVLVEGRKVAGILLESSASAGNTLSWLAVGVGVNIAWHPPDSESQYSATSLKAAGADISGPGELLEEFCQNFLIWYKAWTEIGFVAVREAWMERVHGLHQPICVRLERDTLEGVFINVDESGALILGQNGSQRLIMAGDVFPAGT